MSLAGLASLTMRTRVDNRTRQYRQPLVLAYDHHSEFADKIQSAGISQQKKWRQTVYVA